MDDNDPSRYLKLKKTMLTVVDTLNKEGKEVLSSKAQFAAELLGGDSASEYMGESWLVLREVIHNKNDISEELYNLSCETAEEIRIGFERVGQILPDLYPKK